MKRGDFDLSEVVTALLSLPAPLIFCYISPLLPPSFSLLVPSIFRPPLHLPSLFYLLSLSLLSPPSAGNELSVITIYFDDLFSSLSGENYSLHTLVLVCVCAYIVCVYYNSHPRLIAHPSPYSATHGGEESNGPEQNNGCLHAVVESFICLRPECVPLAFRLTRRPWLMVQPLHVGIYITLWPLCVKRTLGNGCRAVIHHRVEGSDVNDRVEAWTLLHIAEAAHVCHTAMST